MAWIGLVCLLLGVVAILVSILATDKSIPNPVVPTPTPNPSVTATPVTVTQGPIIPGAFLLDTFQTGSVGLLEGHVADTGQTWMAVGSDTSIQLNPGFVQTNVAQSSNQIPLVFYDNAADDIYFQLDFTNLTVSPCQFSWALMNVQGDGLLIIYQYVQASAMIQLDVYTMLGFGPSGPPVQTLTTFEVLVTSMFGVWQTDGTLDMTLTDNSHFNVVIPTTPAGFGVDRFFLSMATTNVATSFQISQVLLYVTQQPTPPTNTQCLVDHFVEPATTLLSNHVAEPISPTVQQWQVVLPLTYDDLTLQIGAPQSGVRKTGATDGSNSVILVNYDPLVDVLYTTVEVVNANLAIDSEFILCVVDAAGNGTQLHLNYDHTTPQYNMFMGSITGYTAAVNIPFVPSFNGTLTSYGFMLYPNGNIMLRFNNDPNYTFSVGGLPAPSAGLFDRIFIWFSGSIAGSNYLTSINSQLFLS